MCAHTCIWIFNQSDYLESRFCVVNILWATKKYKFIENKCLISVKKCQGYSDSRIQSAEAHSYTRQYLFSYTLNYRTQLS